MIGSSFKQAHHRQRSPPTKGPLACSASPPSHSSLRMEKPLEKPGGWGGKPSGPPAEPYMVTRFSLRPFHNSGRGSYFATQRPCLQQAQATQADHKAPGDKHLQSKCNSLGYSEKRNLNLLMSAFTVMSGNSTGEVQVQWGVYSESKKTG